MKRAVVIHPDGHVGPAAISEDRDLYRQLGQLIDGYVTTWPSKVPNITIFCDEDGLMKLHARKNDLATDLAQGGDVPVVGIVVIMGRTTSQGKTYGLTPEQADIFLDPKGEDILNALIGD